MTAPLSPRFVRMCVALHVADVDAAAQHRTDAFPCTVWSHTRLHVEVVARDVPCTVDLFEEPGTAGHLRDHLWVADPDETPWMLSCNPGDVVATLSMPIDQAEKP